jgi:iron complex outermembrane receptor protein
MRYSRSWAVAIGIVCFFSLSGFVLAQSRTGIRGTVMSGTTAITGATVKLLELDRQTHTDGTGAFVFANVPNGKYHIFARVIGYASATNVVTVQDTTSVSSFNLRQTAIQGQEVVISASPYARPTDDQYQSVDSKSRLELHESPGSSFAEELSDLPGVDVRYNGSAPARPILRGLSDNEVLILENGLRTADISTFDPAHSVPIEPDAISEIDVVRGPSSVMYGPNAMGGLVNVITNIIPTATTEGVSGRVSATGNTVSNLYSGYFNTAYSSGGHTFSISAGGTHSDAIKIPSGTYTDPGTGQFFKLDTIPQSFNHTSEEGFGYSYQGAFGMIGVGVKHYQMNYGIPGDPFDTSQMSVGPTSSRIEQEKYTVELRGLFEVDGSFIKQIKLNSNIVDYMHSEHPVIPDSTGLVATDFEQNNFHQNGYNTTLQFLHQRIGNLQGTIGLFANFDNLQIGGLQPLGPNSLTTDLAGYVYEEYFAGDNTRFEGAIRYDYNKIQGNPAPTSTSLEYQTFDSSRTASAVTGSLGLVQKLGSGLTFSLSANRSYRAPTVQELYGLGPDDASASSIVGDSKLVPETGLGIDASLKGQYEGFSFSISPYINLISNYIYSYETGVLDTVNDPSYPYRYFAQTDARLYGFEASTTVQLVEHLAATANIGYVNATATRDSSEPLPFTPPMKGLLRLNYLDNTYSAMVEWRLTAAQTRVGIGENPTAGSGIVNLAFGVRLPMGGVVHNISLHCDNLFNKLYYDHLSVLNGFLPMPGIGVRLTYDVIF